MKAAENRQSIDQTSRLGGVEVPRTRLNRWLWFTGFAVAALVIYWLGVGVAFRWIHASRTQKEFLERKAAVDRFYAPLIWVQKHEPTGLLLVLTNELIRLCVDDPRFRRLGKLPLE